MTAMGRAATAQADDRQRPVLRLLGAEAAADLAGQVVSGRELGRKLGQRGDERRSTAFPTGLAALDGLLATGGEPAGLPRGALVELVGRASSGRLAAALSILAAATRAGEAAAFVDLGDHLDPEGLAAAGADLDRLLWARPRDTGEALAAAEAILTGGLPLVVVDLGLPPVPGGRGAEASWLRLARAAQAHGAALLVSAPYRVSGTAAHAVIAAEKAAAVYGEGGVSLVAGVALRFRLEKLRGHAPGAAAEAVLVEAQSHMEPSVEQEVPSAVVHAFPAENGQRPHNPSARRDAASRAAGGATVTFPAGKLGAGAAPDPRAAAADGAPAERRPEPPPISRRARAGSRPQPPPRPAATNVPIPAAAPAAGPTTTAPLLHTSP